MGTKHQSSSSDPVNDPKKRRRVGFSKIDNGIEPNECIKIYLVSSKEEVDASNCFCIQPVDLNHFFGDEGKIYGYQDLKITIWVSGISFHAYADITFQAKADGGKGITDLRSALQDIFAENLVEKKDDFLQTFSTESDHIDSIVSKGEILQQKAANGHNSDPDNLNADGLNVEIIRVVGVMPVGHLYSRLVPLVLLLVDGSNPIDITDPRWEILLMIQRETDLEASNKLRLLGFAAIYRFYCYPDSLRLRLGQILVLPPYQHKGYGRLLLEVLNRIAIGENVYDLTVEEPSDSLQHVRTCIDVQCLINFSPIQQALNAAILRMKLENLSKKSKSCSFGPPVSAVEDVRRSLKINKKQFLQCWEVLIYLGLDPIDKYMENFTTIISDRVRADVIGKDPENAGKRVVDVPTEYDQEMSFVMFRSKTGEATGMEIDENQTNQEQQLKQLVDERLKDIKSVAEKVSPKHL